MSGDAWFDGFYELLMAFLGASYGHALYDHDMTVTSLVLAVLAAVYLLYAMLYPERF